MSLWSRAEKAILPDEQPRQVRAACVGCEKGVNSGAVEGGEETLL